MVTNDFKKLIKDFGSRIILIHSHNKVECSCYDTLYNVANPDCEVCNGSGFLSEVTEIKARQGGVTSTGTLIKINDTQIGDINTLIRIFYIENREVSDDDIICECLWKPNDKTPTIKSVYDINYQEPICNGEEIVYLKLITTLKACKIPKVTNIKGKIYVGVNNLA